MRRTFKFKAKINKTTEAKALNWLALCRWLYNSALEQRINVYKNCKKTLTYYDQTNEFPRLKEEFPEFKTIDAQVLQNVLKTLDNAYKSFFRRLKKGEKPGFPRFKSKDRYDSFTLHQHSWKLEGRNLIIKKVGTFKLFLSREIQGKIKTITIKRTKTNDWYVSFHCDDVPKKKFFDRHKSVGIDVGIKYFLTDSEGNTVANPKFFRKSEKDLKRKQRSLSRKTKGSKRRLLAKLQVARIHEKISNQCQDFVSKTALYYVRRYSTIFIEDLQVRNMVKNHNLAKSISDASWSMFFSKLCDKAEEAGRKIIKVDPRNTSQNCSGCGQKVPKKLSVRIHSCPYCGLSLDRDMNAAINILQRGRTVLADAKHQVFN